MKPTPFVWVYLKLTTSIPKWKSDPNILGFSGLPKKGANRTEAGVAVVVPNKYRNYLLDIIPVYEKMIIAIFNSVIPIMVIFIHAPTAPSCDTAKSKLYDALHRQCNLYKNKGIVYICGDFNTRIQKAIETDCNTVSPHTFNHENAIEKDEDVVDNVERLVNFCIANNMKIMICFFSKPP